ncbi:MAG: peptidoglycan DD-metalloendopeptidase family protein [Lachnospiraceae bacterium]|nr:peptidoglycan DD-metalloendopeptidase family protein [Lachnospiraceae bacterium]
MKLVRNSALCFLLVLCLAGSAFQFHREVYATEERDSETEENDSEEVDTEAIQESIREKQDAIREAQNEKKKLQSGITDIKKMINSLSNQKKDMENYVLQLDKQMTSVEEKITQIKTLIQQKETQIQKTRKELEEAEAVEDAQYESMKVRIKLMYERGEDLFFDMLLSANSYGDFLNKADYIESFSAYDRKMLEEYQANCEYIHACEEQLEAEEQVLEEAKKSVETEQANLNTLISTKRNQISSYQTDITNKEAAIKEYEAEIAARTAVIQALEAAVAEEARRLQESGGEVSVTYDGGMFAWPAPSYTRISDDYGNRMHPTLGVQQFHNGVDMAAPGGSAILAAYDGEVVAADYNSSMGNYIMINHGNGLYTIYMHASSLAVSKGTYVVRGQRIGSVGSTGRSTGNHLHFSVRRDGSYVNPWGYLR